MKKVITRVEFEWDKDKQEYVAVSSEYYLSNESFALCEDGGDDGDSSDSSDSNDGPDSGDANAGTDVGGDPGSVGSAGNDYGYSGDSEGNWMSDLTSWAEDNLGFNPNDNSWNFGGPDQGPGIGGSGGLGRAEDELDTSFSGARSSLTAANMPTQDEFGNWGLSADQESSLNGIGWGYNQDQMSRANQEYNSLSFHGAFNNPVSSLEGLFGISHNSWDFTGLDNQSHTNWGQIGNDLGHVFTSPVAATIGTFLGYGPVLGAINGTFNASQGKGLSGVVSGVAGLLGLDAATRAGLGIATNFAEGKTGQAIGQVAQTALGMNGVNLGNTLNTALSNDKGSIASAVTNQLGNMAQAAAVGYAASSIGSSINNSVASGPAGVSSLSTGVSNNGSAVSSTGFNLAGGLDNNGGTGSFDLNKGIVGGGLSALGAALLTGNNNMASGINLGDLGSLGASLYGQFGDQYSKNLGNIANSADPSLYNGLLAESYTNPAAVYDRNYAPLDKAFYGEMMANDSAAGRTTDAYKHGLAREAQFQQFLNQYRSGLSGTVNGRLPTYTGLQKSAATNTQDLKNTTVNALSKLFGGGTAGGNGLAGLFSTGISKAGSYLGDLWDNATYNYDGSYQGNNSNQYDLDLPEVDTSWYDNNNVSNTPADQSEYDDYMSFLDR